MISLFKNSSATVEAIHNEFDTAEDRLLEEATRIIAEHDNLDFAKGEQLVRLGFTKSEEAVELREKAEMIQKNGEQAKLVLHYKKDYPFLKFLTKSELDRICDKYNLIYAPVGAYTKKVPKKNLDEIEQAKPLDKEDMSMPGITVKVWEKNIHPNTPDNVKKDLLAGKNIKFDPVAGKGIVDQIRAGTFGFDSTALFSSTFAQLYSRSTSHDLKAFIYKPTGKRVSEYCRYSTMDYEVETLDETGLFIAAPESHFDLTGLAKGKKGYMKLLQKKVDDPIVFRWVKGGIQVLTKWGLEANDPALANELLN